MDKNKLLICTIDISGLCNNQFIRGPANLFYDVKTETLQVETSSPSINEALTSFEDGVENLLIECIYNVNVYASLLYNLIHEEDEIKKDCRYYHEVKFSDFKLYLTLLLYITVLYPDDGSVVVPSEDYKQISEIIHKHNNFLLATVFPIDGVFYNVIIPSIIDMIKKIHNEKDDWYLHLPNYINELSKDEGLLDNYHQLQEQVKKEESIYQNKALNEKFNDFYTVIFDKLTDKIAEGKQ